MRDSLQPPRGSWSNEELLAKRDTERAFGINDPASNSPKLRGSTGLSLASRKLPGHFLVQLCAIAIQLSPEQIVTYVRLSIYVPPVMTKPQHKVTRIRLQVYNYQDQI